MAENPFFKITYGLYILTAKDGKKDNGCVINTLSQVTSRPELISVTVNKSNFTRDMIDKTKEFNVSVLTEKTPFGVFEHFGFQSGRDAEKFFGNTASRSENGICYLSEYTNAFFSARVIEQHEYETHTVFVAEVTESAVLSDEPSLSYDYYHKNIKPKPQKQETKKGWRCKICGYVYEEDELPKDFICPLCKHPASDFERI